MSQEMSVENIRVGSIVRVINDAFRFFGYQGVVVKIAHDENPDGPVGVQFPTWYGRIFDYPDPLNSVVRLDVNDLRVEERFDEIPLDVFLKRLFGRMGVWTVNRPSYPLIPGDTECMHEGCEEKAWFAILVNVFGAVTEFYTCPDHTHYHGVCCDGFPMKKV
ncbi:MAG: hypothetical protein WDZ85_00690 [Candidatus Paceibacterota bacterium]